jgi:hypothetical protein
MKWKFIALEIFVTVFGFDAPLIIGCPHLGGRLFCFASPGSLTSLSQRSTYQIKRGLLAAFHALIVLVYYAWLIWILLKSRVCAD